MMTLPSASQTHRLVARSIVGLIAASLLVACEAKAPAGAASASSSPATAAANPKIRALLDKTLKNLRFIEGGSFQMGDFGPLDAPDKLPYNGRADNKVLHKVTLDSFSMSAYKTTYEDHDVYSETVGKPLVGTDELTKKYRYPTAAAGLLWQQARDYCQWLGQRLDLPMDLPTEAQWEYAARNRGAFFLFATDNGKVDAGRNVWEYSQRKDFVHTLTQEGFNPPSLPLGRFPPTPLGLYDMMTDGFEWTRDWYDPNYYTVSPEKNPQGPVSGSEKVLRSWRSSDGEGISYGDGQTTARSHRQPDPPKLDAQLKPVPNRNMVADTGARCVVNRPAPIGDTR